MQQLVAAWAEAGDNISRLRVPIPVPLQLSYSNRKAETELDWTQVSFVEALKEARATESAA